MYTQNGIKHRDIPLGPPWDEFEAQRMEREDKAVRTRQAEYTRRWDRYEEEQ
jgi:hypothetical protein